MAYNFFRVEYTVYNETPPHLLKDPQMTLNVVTALRDRRAYAAYLQTTRLETERHYRQMELISNASKNGMK